MLLTSQAAAINSLLLQGAEALLVDFDEHLLNTSLDWLLNPELTEHMKKHD